MREKDMNKANNDVQEIFLYNRKTSLKAEVGGGGVIHSNCYTWKK
jgi:hypothetical protein